MAIAGSIRLTRGNCSFVAYMSVRTYCLCVREFVRNTVGLGHLSLPAVDADLVGGQQDARQLGIGCVLVVLS